jgi:hypothetical protein
MERFNVWRVVLKNTVCFAAAVLPSGKLLPPSNMQPGTESA